MSRGYGVVQRRILDILAKQDRLINTIELAALAFDVQPNAAGRCVIKEAQAASVRRALGKLVRDGKALDCGRGWHHGRHCWANPAAAQRYREQV